MIKIHVISDKAALGAQAAALGAKAIREALRVHGYATIVVGTGASQFETLRHLVVAEGIDWSKVAAFHLDEYVSLPQTHPGSFRRYLQDRFVEPVGGKVKFVWVSGEGDPREEISRLNALIGDQRIDVCFAGIGENGHLAFNDPPADLETEAPYLLVTLDEGCRKQQVGEGWFENFEAVPERAISMTVKQILKSALIILSVPDSRKAKAVRDAVEGPVSPLHPASILQTHGNTVLFLDSPAASLLKAETVSSRWRTSSNSTVPQE